MRKRIYSEYDRQNQSSPEEKRKRNLRNVARRRMFRFLEDKHGSVKAKSMMKGKDVHHKKPLKDGGTNDKSNLSLVEAAINRAKK